MGSEELQMTAGAAAVGVYLEAGATPALGPAEDAPLQGPGDPPRVSPGALTGVLDEPRLQVEALALRTLDLHTGTVEGTRAVDTWHR